MVRHDRTVDPCTNVAKFLCSAFTCDVTDERNSKISSCLIVNLLVIGACVVPVSAVYNLWLVILKFF